MTRMHSAIVTFHSIDNSGSVISFPPAAFRRQIERLAESGIPVVPLEQVTATPGSIALTFDDGYGNLLDHAVPALVQYLLPATVFVVSRYCGTPNQWPGQPSTIPKLSLLGWRDLAALPPQITVGAHTATHPRLDTVTKGTCESELRTCKEEIEQRLGRDVRSLAYPYGVSSQHARNMREPLF